MTTENFLVFALASLVLNITPGSDMIYVIARSSGQGARAGILSSFGVMAGCFLHVFAAAFGLSALLATSALAYSGVVYAGAGYLIYLGIKTLLDARKQLEATGPVAPLSNSRIFWQGALTNVLNPKVAVFFLAFLPQFVQPATPNSTIQFLLLGLWFNVSGTLVNVGVALAFGKIGHMISSRPGVVQWQQRFTAVMLLGLGLKLAFSRN